MSGPPPGDPRTDLAARWWYVLHGTGERRARFQRIFSHLPSDPRCRMCAAPFGGPIGSIVGALGWGRMKTNPQLCNLCFVQMEQHQGGSEVEISILFADVRGSTALAEQMTPADYKQTLDGFYKQATDAIVAEGGIVDKFLGDGIMALFIPGFITSHAQAAISAAQSILAAAELPIGAGIHTGNAYVGFMGGGGGVMGFSAVGDAVNTAYRLGEVASAAELLISETTAAAANLTTDALERRELSVKGREQPIATWVQHIEPRSAAPAASADAA